MQDQQNDPQQEYVEHLAEREANRTSPAENEKDELGDESPDQPAQPGRAAASSRGEQASPTGAVGLSDYPLDDDSRRRG
ncbi:hypothetical protein [Prauserella muralis]|uniref:Uncharacterized protein n=1 Tax=Prauserella muralis TaxID=588067 RepID=A0A2V4ARN6_9PSEU|nr:hypothetical protein [Prauserella muralis]PXY22191.1 hypothetical protein BAY60_20075 [Prauserella muralis]TWE27800.1 hypothetical protein FHX69_0447 [Prauserella muralis]